MSNGFVFMLSSQESHDHVLLDIPVTREKMNHYRAAAETAQSELAALSVKYDCAQSEVHLKISSNPSLNLRILCITLCREQKACRKSKTCFCNRTFGGFVVINLFLESLCDFYFAFFCDQELIISLYLKDLKQSSFLSSSKFNLFILNLKISLSKLWLYKSSDRYPPVAGELRSSCPSLLISPLYSSYSSPNLLCFHHQ